MFGILRRLVKDQRGSALPIMAAGLIPVLAAVGSAVDIGRVYMVRAQMQAGVDAGALAGARSFGLNEERVQQVSNYFLANMPEGLLGSRTITPASDFQTTSGINRVKVDATTDLPMVFMHLFGISTMNIAVTATAEMQPRPLEVMVVLDDTGSMQTTLPSSTVTRMGALKTAMYDFNNILHQGKATREDLAMGFVTYTVTTNVGATLRKYGVAIDERDGYTNLPDTDPARWLGCVENDVTVKDISASATTFEAGAYDIDKVLPGESGRPGAQPYNFPPLASTVDVDKNTNLPIVPATSTSTSGNKVNGAWATGSRQPIHYIPFDKNNTTNPAAKQSDSRRNNFYRLAPKGDDALGRIRANKAIYRQHFYDFYIGLNADPAYPDDDVIVKAGGGYYAPGSADAWEVEYSRIPYLNDDTAWTAANGNYGFSGRGKSLNMPTPNWQCPHPAVEVAYGRTKAFYDEFIDKDNLPLMPASGTLHHIGMLWGYRLLTRDDVFTRTIPNQFRGEQPLRALVFMTDGETAADGAATWYGAYGYLKQKRITNSTNADTFKNQVMARFAKVCENAKRDGIEVYIVSLLGTASSASTNTAFRNCAGANYRETYSQSEIRQAFQQIAVDLVDLHLTH